MKYLNRLSLYQNQRLTIAVAIEETVHPFSLDREYLYGIEPNTLDDLILIGRLVKIINEQEKILEEARRAIVPNEKK